ncbi:MAG: DUF1501 domain-containing protein [Planctomycetota bacterium]
MHLTRRFFLQTSGALAAYCGVAPIEALAKSAQAASALAIPQPVTPGKSLVVIFLRGGIDGLNLIVPHADPHYAGLRQALRINAPGEDQGCIDLDGFFGLHPRAQALMPWVEQGQFVAAHAVGYDHNTRSHFEEQDTWETGVIGNTVNSDGWLNRHLLTSTGHGHVRAISLGNNLPRILRGDAPAYAVRGIDDLTLPQARGNAQAIHAALEHAYCQPLPDHRTQVAEEATTLAHDAGAVTLDGIDTIQKVADQPYTPAADYPSSGLANQLKQAARLIKADVGLEVVTVDYGGWDTHRGQGAGISGNYGNKVNNLADALHAFATDLGDRLDDTLVLTLSDFGRTAKENGTQGTDHGWGNCMLAMGGGVAKTGERVDGSSSGRRKVVGRWPGLGEDQLHQKRDLLHTTDFRDVLGEAVASHLGNQHLKTILPNHEFAKVGLIA